jgi:hypothetical protein
MQNSLHNIEKAVGDIHIEKDHPRTAREQSQKVLAI